MTNLDSAARHIAGTLLLAFASTAAMGALPRPTLSLSASPVIVAPGTSVTVKWTSTNATYCRMSALGRSQSVPTSGQVTTAIASTTTASLTCSGAGGSRSASVTVSATAASAPAPATPAAPSVPTSTGSPPAPSSPDSDRDGVLDVNDDCPTQPATTVNGCPAVTPTPSPSPAPSAGVTSAWWLDQTERDRLLSAISRGDSEATYWVNLMTSALANRSAYSDIPAWQLALAGALLNRTDFCSRAISEAQALVARDPTGANIRSSSETFLRMPELYDEIVLPWAFCRPQTTSTQRAAWATYLNAGLDAMWRANETYWPFDDPHNNYFHHYMYVTALVGVVTEGDNPRAASWRSYYENKLNTRLLPAWTSPIWTGAGGSEGHYYDAYAYRMLWTAYLYGRATGQNLVGRFGFTPGEYLNSEMHSTRPDYSGFWQMGDEANVASAPFTTNNRQLWLLLMRLAPSESGHAKSLLALSTTGRDFPGRNARVWNFVQSDRAITSQSLATKLDTMLTLPSSGRTFLRTNWSQSAVGMVLFHNRVDNTPGESHDHVDAPGFQWSSGSTPLIVDPNAYGSSGIVGTQSNGGATVANIVRLPNATTGGGSPQLTRSEDNRAQGISHTIHVINAQPYWNNASVYRREYVTLDDLRVVVVFDRIVGGGDKTWQVHVPSGGGPRVTNLFPAGTLSQSSVSGFSGVTAIRQVSSSADYRSVKVLDIQNRLSSATLSQGAGYLEAQLTIGGAVRRIRFFDDGSATSVY